MGEEEWAEKKQFFLIKRPQTFDPVNAEKENAPVVAAELLGPPNRYHMTNRNNGILTWRHSLEAIISPWSSELEED